MVTRQPAAHEVLADLIASGQPPIIAIQSREFALAALRDFRSVSPSDANSADAFFGELGVVAAFQGAPSYQVAAWEFVLQLLLNADAPRFAAIHKGTPYYFLGTYAYLARDYETAAFYIDAALSEDTRRSYTWHSVPSGLFLRLDDSAPRQFAKRVVEQARTNLEAWQGPLATAGGTPLSLRLYRARLVNAALASTPALRTLASALLSFVLEAEQRILQLEITPAGVGTSEPFYLHLFKGCLVFESLLKASAQGQLVVAVKASAGKGVVLGDLLQNIPLMVSLGYPSGLVPIGARTLADSINGIAADAASGSPFPLRALRATWSLRNQVGHNLGWPTKPTPEEHRRLCVLILGAITHVLVQLYPEQLLPTGDA